MAKTVKSTGFNLKLARKAIAMSQLFFSDDMDTDPRKSLIEGLNKLDTAISHNQLAPIPQDLVGSMYDPEMMMALPDDEFCEFYEDNMKDTAEEILIAMIASIISKDEQESIIDKTVPIPMLIVDGGRQNKLKDLRGYIGLLKECIQGGQRGMHNDVIMLNVAFHYLISFIDKMKFNANVFLSWYLRYAWNN